MIARCTYLLPIRRAAFSAAEADELARYFGSLRDWGCEVIVVDGSPDDVFVSHAERWRDLCHHARVDRSFRCLNDKVNGVRTGAALANTHKIILADDDIRYGAEELGQIVDLLDRFDVVRPQNFLSPLRWWARMEAARMLVNRATLRTADYPGTCAFHRNVFDRFGGYDGDVLFDNEEIIRHFARAGAKICYAKDLFVRKLPPTLRKWREQRPRQAYEDFDLRLKTLFFWSILPALLLVGIFGGGRPLVVLLALISCGSMLLAFLGWSRGTARSFFPIDACLFAPLWIFERAISTHLAVYWFVTRGGYPFGDKVLVKGIGRDWVAGGRIASQIAGSQRRNG